MFAAKHLSNKVLAIDLDGTLLHPEPEAVPVWGRSGYRYMSGKSAELLAEISNLIPVVIATGRNAQSVQRLVCQLENVSFCGFVTENGLVSRRYLKAINYQDKWDDVTGLLPDWERLSGYEECLGLMIPLYAEEPEKIVAEVLVRRGKTGHIYRENRKLFVYPFMPSKLSGIRDLGFEPFIALGDEVNDLDMLDAAAYPATLITAHKDVRHCVRKKKGYCSDQISHAATEVLLKYVGEKLRESFE